MAQRVRDTDPAARVERDAPTAGMVQAEAS
jgi:hypothetical protein